MKLSYALLFLLLAVSASVAQKNLLGNGDFEAAQDEQPLGWGIQDAARSQDGELRSAFQLNHDPDPLHHHTLQLAGTAHTAIWVAAVSQEFAVVPGTRLQLKGAMRTRDVRRELQQFENCNLALRFERADGSMLPPGQLSVQASSKLLGTTPWTDVSRVVHVPEGATQARVLCFLSMSGVAWFDDISVALMDAPDWIVTPGKNFKFHHLKGDRLPDSDRARTESNLLEMEKALELKLNEPIDFFKYEDSRTLEKLTGRLGDAHVGPGHTLHTVEASDRHELVHLLLKQIGAAETTLFSEGIAVSLTGPWQKKDVDDWVRQLATAGRLPRLKDMVEHQAFSALGEDVAYPVAGSFVRFLLARAGMSKFKRAYPLRGELMDPQRFFRQFDEVYGGSLEEWEEAWRSKLGLAE